MLRGQCVTVSEVHLAAHLREVHVCSNVKYVYVWTYRRALELLLRPTAVCRLGERRV